MAKQNAEDLSIDLSHIIFQVWEHQAEIIIDHLDDFKYMILNQEIIEKLITKKTFFGVAIHLLSSPDKGKLKVDIDKFISFINLMTYYSWDESFKNEITRVAYVSYPSDDKQLGDEQLKVISIKKHLENLRYETDDDILNPLMISLISDFTIYLQGKQITLMQDVLNEHLNSMLESNNIKAYLILSLETINLCVDFGLNEITDNLLKQIFSYESFLHSLNSNYQIKYYLQKGLYYSNRLKTQHMIKSFNTANRILLNNKEVNEITKSIQYNINKSLANHYKKISKYNKSLQLFESVMPTAKLYKDNMFFYNLATLYMEINEPELALQSLQNIDISQTTLGFQRAIINSLSILAYIHLDQEPIALEFVKTTLMADIVSLSDRAIKQLFNVILFFNDSNLDALQKEFQILDLIHNMIIADPKSFEEFATPYLLLTHYLKSGHIEKANELVKKYKHIINFEEFSKDIYATRARMLYYYYFQNKVETVRQLLHIIKLFNEQVPTRKDVRFSANWIKDKKGIQQDIVEISFEYYKFQAIDLIDLLAAIDIKCGRDISAKLSVQKWTFREILDNVQKKYSRTSVYVLFEANSYLHAIQIYDQNIQLYSELLPIDQVKLVTKRLTYLLKYAPTDYPDTINSAFEKLWFKLSPIEIMVNLSVPNNIEHICFITGEACSNLPLQLLKQINGSYWLESSLITFITSLSSLALLEQRPQTKPTTILVRVDKAGTSQNNDLLSIERLNRIIDLLSNGQYNPKILQQLIATKKRVLYHLNRCTEAIFVCHGSKGETTLGNGICLAYEAQLPPSFLNPKAEDFLNNFLLSWQDLESLSKMPRLFISLACSSGQVNIGPGGIYYGFEQIAFAKGNTTIISPLWDIDRQASLFWLEQFYYQRGQQLSVGKSYQLASLITRQQYPHFFHWAPFIIKGIA